MQTGMTVRLGASFLLSWSQCELDGQPAAPWAQLRVGACWRWAGRAMLANDLGQDLAWISPSFWQDDAPGRAGFAVTDGQDLYRAEWIDIGVDQAGLLLFRKGVPPAGALLRVVNCWPAQDAALGDGSQGAGVICFGADTRISTPDGPRLVQHLRRGDVILTKDNGPQPIIWTGHKTMSGARLHAMPRLRPIRLRGHALGQGQPDGDLIVSPQHRMLVRGPAALALFNSAEVLVQAQDLIDGQTVLVDRSLKQVTYFHLLLERHNIVFANGLETESFHPAQAALDRIEEVQKAALLDVMPSIDGDPHGYGAAARRNLSPAEAAILRYDMAV